MIKFSGYFLSNTVKVDRLKSSLALHNLGSLDVELLVEVDHINGGAVVLHELLEVNPTITVEVG